MVPKLCGRLEATEERRRPKGQGLCFFKTDFEDAFRVVTSSQGVLDMPLKFFFFFCFYLLFTLSGFLCPKFRLFALSPQFVTEPVRLSGPLEWLCGAHESDSRGDC